ncbi:TetR/AcrR family transcriptional regulator [Halobaculum sp. MBLA0147]|uniref:TetR/AcrR family transcriptional regulator n=1 Tax=Halobaculum sp. MBLA0147 TaxID=3079934 RepID=UPI0035256127
MTDTDTTTTDDGATDRAGDDSPGAAFDDTQRAIMEATYCAVCEHGFADVTMQDIADRTDNSKAALHYHYEGRDDLFRQFLSYLHADFVERTADPPGDSPAERLLALIRTVLSTADESGDGGPGDADERAGGGDGDAEPTQFTTAFLEMKAQAPYREGLRDGLARIDARATEQVERLVTDGIEAGEFPPETDPESVASFVTTYLHGTWTRSAAAGNDVGAMRRHLETYLRELVTDETAARLDPPSVAAVTESDGTDGQPPRDEQAPADEQASRDESSPNEEVAE